MGSKRSKIIFLDIDGVLNCNKTPNPHDLPYVVDKRLLRVFNTFVSALKRIEAPKRCTAPDALQSDHSAYLAKPVVGTSIRIPSEAFAFIVATELPISSR